MAKTALQGNPVSLAGDLPAVGSTAPDFKLVTKDLGDVTLADYAGKKKAAEHRAKPGHSSLRHVHEEV